VLPKTTPAFISEEKADYDKWALLDEMYVCFADTRQDDEIKVREASFNNVASKDDPGFHQE
jgi:hypothetical protein